MDQKPVTLDPPIDEYLSKRSSLITQISPEKNNFRYMSNEPYIEPFDPTFTDDPKSESIDPDADPLDGTSEPNHADNMSDAQNPITEKTPLSHTPDTDPPEKHDSPIDDPTHIENQPQSLNEDPNIDLYNEAQSSANDSEIEDIDEEVADDQAIVEAPNDPTIWTLPGNKDDCTLEEIRRGQVMNKTAPNECPVPGCGKKINEARAEPSPGTIASGLRTHVLFVHYANRKSAKKRKTLTWTKRRNQPSPKKSNRSTSPSSIKREYDFGTNHHSSGLNLSQKSQTHYQVPQYGNGSLLDKRSKIAPQRTQPYPMSSLQSLMQATSGQKSSPLSNRAAKNVDVNNTQNGLNPTTSSLFSILAGLTQHQQSNQQQQSLLSKNKQSNASSSNANLSAKNPLTDSRCVNSSLLSLLNEKISGNVASSLENQLKKTLSCDTQNKPHKFHNSTSRQGLPAQSSTSYYQSNNSIDNAFNGGSSILNNLCSTASDNRLSQDSPVSLNSFIESIAFRTGSNIGSSGILEARKIIEKFTTSLLYSAQTIADHYVAPFSNEVPQQKPEISPSDVMLAYKMMHKTLGQP